MSELAKPQKTGASTTSKVLAGFGVFFLVGLAVLWIGFHSPEYMEAPM